MPEPETTPHPPSGSNDSAVALLAVVDAYLADLQAGKTPDRAAVLAAHPELAPRLESCLAALDFIHRAERTDPAVLQTLGDFRIVREIGRGAMGVVYEAEQLSLKRHVALKVLRFGTAPDAEAMTRFRREAETVAALHHTNIVPLFAVGSEADIHFFAMQLITGRSLAAVLEETARAGKLPDAMTVAGWGVQAAEALAHAHARGVVHRDVKPSNLLLDGEGTVWLTDFGLARRSDEATLTTAGVLLGTPRYMSPEQAQAARTPVDQRSDVYSLGATLYELATGKPVFEAESAGQLFEQIAAAEPVPPRKHRPDLPRDLETVLLRCLAKDPAQRYPTARELADDLRRVTNGDPVKARRPGLLLMVRRWAGRRQAAAFLVAATVVTTVILLLATLFAWNAYHDIPRGSVTLKFEGTKARAEIFGADGKPAVVPFTLPTPAPIEFPCGWYQLRVIQPGQLSEDYQLLIEEGRQRTFTVGCHDRQLWEPMPIKTTVVGDFGRLRITSVSEPSPTTVVLQRFTQRKPGRNEDWEKFNPFVPVVLWELQLKRPDHPVLARLTDDEWKAFCARLMSFGKNDDKEEKPADRKRGGRPQLIQPAPDLNGDGVGDLVFLFDQYVLVISGRDGTLLWCRELHSNLFLTNTQIWRWSRDKRWNDLFSSLSWSLARAAPALTVPVPQFGSETPAELAGPPLVVADIDGDNCPDLILSHSAFRCELGDCLSERLFASPCVEAISGRTGLTLWRHGDTNLEDRFFRGNENDLERIRRGEYSIFEKLIPARGFASMTERPSPPTPLPGVPGRGERKGRMLVAGLFSRFIRLDLHTGQTMAPPGPVPRIDKGYGMHPRAWSADGKIAIVEWGYIGEDGAFHESGGSLNAIDTVSGKQKDDRLGGRPSIFADLNGDGVPEIISGAYSGAVYDGATGKELWRHRLQSRDSKQEEQETGLAGPDLDGDGCRDLFVAAVADGERYGHAPGVKVLLAGLRSGKDGRLLWVTAEPIALDPSLDRNSGSFHLGSNEKRQTDQSPWGLPGVSFSWQSAPGTPGHFVVNVVVERELGWGGKSEPAWRAAFVFAADTGRCAHIWPEVTALGIADLDADGMQDLYGRRGDHLVSVRGAAAEEWRRPGRWRWHEREYLPTYLSQAPFRRLIWTATASQMSFSSHHGRDRGGKRRSSRLIPDVTAGGSGHAPTATIDMTLRPCARPSGSSALTWKARVGRPWLLRARGGRARGTFVRCWTAEAEGAG